MAHLLVTNDFPPKVGGIQSYLWELWRRLPPDHTTVLTTPYAGTEHFDAAAPMRIVRTRQRWLLPTPVLAKQIRSLAAEVGASLVVLDPAVPVGILGPSLGLPYAVVLHGAEVAIPGRIPGSKQILGRVLRRSAHLIAAGQYPLAEGLRAAGTQLPATNIVPGVDIGRFSPADDAQRAATRSRLRLPSPDEGLLIVGASRLVPRKGYDTVIEAAGQLATQFPGLTVAISGAGRDRTRLEKLAQHVEARSGLRVAFLGRLSDEDLADLYAAADVYAMCCRNRWGGLEQEGFGIVFSEASASGVAVLAGNSGGVADAVVDGTTGLVVPKPVRVEQATPLLRQLLSDAALRQRFGAAGRLRCEHELTYDLLAAQLDDVLAGLERRIG
jgi:phosphatidyl-myo-inositol dimannoside synthase